MTRRAPAIWVLRLCGLGLLRLAGLPVFAGEQQPPEPEGYCQGPMNGHVPATIAGGR